jgi:glycosyltransferase involved in cell wall biosynthesis
MIEAMACGTPVLAYRAGAVAEVIDEGVTGMIVENIDQARIALAQAALMDRLKVRRRFEERFTARRMANDYVRVFRSLIRRAPKSANDLAIRRERTGATDLVADPSVHAD